jgi:hypothetical protein
MRRESALSTIYVGYSIKVPYTFRAQTGALRIEYDFKVATIGPINRGDSRPDQWASVTPRIPFPEPRAFDRHVVKRTNGPEIEWPSC